MLATAPGCISTAGAIYLLYSNNSRDSVAGAHERGNISVMSVNFVTTGQIGQELGLSRQRVDKIIREAKDFPEPEVVLPNGARLWSRTAALKWFKRNPRRPYRRHQPGPA